MCLRAFEREHTVVAKSDVRRVDETISGVERVKSLLHFILYCFMVFYIITISKNENAKIQKYVMLQSFPPLLFEYRKCKENKKLGGNKALAYTDYNSSVKNILLIFLCNNIQ